MQCQIYCFFGLPYIMATCTKVIKLRATLSARRYIFLCFTAVLFLSIHSFSCPLRFNLYQSRSIGLDLVYIWSTCIPKVKSILQNTWWLIMLPIPTYHHYCPAFFIYTALFCNWPKRKKCKDICISKDSRSK